MKESDLPEVESISRKVYNVKSKSWIRAQYLSGDIGFVAKLDGKIAGFALQLMLTVTGVSIHSQYYLNTRIVG